MTVFPSQLGWMAAAWRGQRLCELTFGHTSPSAAARGLRWVAATDTAEIDPVVGQWISRLRHFALGDHGDDFRDVPLELADLTDFQRSVLRQCRRIPAGHIVTYGELARRAGRSGAARAVGQVMATNRFPLIVPCHRVVAAGGRLGGYSAPPGLALKKRLLAAEGVTDFSAANPRRRARGNASSGRSGTCQSACRTWARCYLATADPPTES